MMEDKGSAIAILGSGTWGLSTALYLTDAGYTNITVFDKAEEIPSRYSAAHDLNKIVRPEYEDPFYTELALVRRFPPGWRDLWTKTSPAKHRGLENASFWPILSPNRVRGSGHGTSS